MPVMVISVLWTFILVPEPKYSSFISSESQLMVLLCFHDLDEEAGKQLYIANLYIG